MLNFSRNQVVCLAVSGVISLHFAQASAAMATDGHHASSPAADSKAATDSLANSSARSTVSQAVSNVHSTGPQADSTAAPEQAASSKTSSTTTPTFDDTYKSALKAIQDGKYEQAEKLLKDTLKMEEKQGGTELKRDHSVMLLADLYKSQKKLAQAETLYKQLLSKLETKPAGDELAAVMNLMAGLYQAEHKFDESLTLYKKALALVEKQNGPESATAGMVHKNIGLLFQEMGKLKEAEAEEVLALKLLRAKVPGSPELAACLTELAPQFLYERKTNEAIQLLEQALTIYDKVAPGSIKYANCAEQLGAAYCAVNRFSDAEDLSRKALAIYQKWQGPESTDAAIALTNLAGRLASEDKNNDALDNFRKSYAIQEKSGQFSVGMLNNLRGMAEVYVKQDEFKKCENVLRRYLDLVEKHFGPKHMEVLPALINLGNCLIVEGASGEEADVLMNRSEEIRSQTPLTQKKLLQQLIEHDVIKALDVNTKQSKKKKNAIW